MRIVWTFGLAVAAWSVTANAYGDTQEQHIGESIVIDAPPETVWAVAGDFALLSNAYQAGLQNLKKVVESAR